MSIEEQFAEDEDQGLGKPSDLVPEGRADVPEHIQNMSDFAEIAYQAPNDRPKRFANQYDYHEDLSTPDTAVYSSNIDLVVAPRGSATDRPGESDDFDDELSTGLGAVGEVLQVGSLQKRFDANKEVIRQARLRHPDHALHITGHGVGGHLAKDLARKFPDSTGYTFEAPEGLPTLTDVACAADGILQGKNTCDNIHNFRKGGNLSTFAEKIFGAGETVTDRVKPPTIGDLPRSAQDMTDRLKHRARQTVLDKAESLIARKHTARPPPKRKDSVDKFFGGDGVDDRDDRLRDQIQEFRHPYSKRARMARASKGTAVSLNP